MFDQVNTYIYSLFAIAKTTRDAALEIGSLKNDINKSMFVHLLQLEGVPCKSDDLILAIREQGIATKIVVPTGWRLKGHTLPGLSHLLCRTRVHASCGKTPTHVDILDRPRRLFPYLPSFQGMTRRNPDRGETCGYGADVL